MIKEGSRYVVVKPIPLGGGSFIHTNKAIYKVHGCLYMDGGLLSKSYCEDFERLVAKEEKTGWNYLRPESI